MNESAHLDIRVTVTVAGDANTMKPRLRKVGHTTGSMPRILCADTEKSDLQFLAEPNGGSLQKDRELLHDEIVDALEAEGIEVFSD